MPEVFLDLIRAALDIYFYAVFAWIILSWIPMSPGHPLGRFQEFLDRIITPVIRPIRRVIPPVRLGAGALDLSPLILLLGLRIIRRLI